MVIRLNEDTYPTEGFERNGIEHKDLFFMDGSIPSQSIIETFNRTCDQHFIGKNSGAIAVHCKAGLGRTGTLIGLFAMKNYKISAPAFIGWSRIARPGSVLGPQQYFLQEMEE